MIQKQTETRRANMLLLLGASLGLLLAASGLFEPSSDSLPTDIMARIGDQLITKAEYQNHLQRLSDEKRNPLTREDQQRLLDLLIDERLLVAQGLNLGLINSDAKVRRLIVERLLESVLAEVENRTPTEEELQNFFQTNRDYFARPGRLQVRHLHFRGDNAEVRVVAAVSALSDGKSYVTVINDLADAGGLTVPDKLLPLNSLRRYLGPTLTDKALQLQTGELSEPILMDDSYHLLQLVARESVQPAQFEEVKTLVANELRRRHKEQALQEYLQQLRGQVSIAVDNNFLLGTDRG